MGIAIVRQFVLGCRYIPCGCRQVFWTDSAARFGIRRVERLEVDTLVLRHGKDCGRVQAIAYA